MQPTPKEKNTWPLATGAQRQRQVRQVGTSHGLCPRDNEEVRAGGCVPCRNAEQVVILLRKHLNKWGYTVTDVAMESMEDVIG